MAETMFNQEPQAAPAAQEPAPATAVVDYQAVLQSITNDEGTPKYADVNTALASIAPSQTHIKTIEQENAILKEELSKRQTAEDLLSQFKKPLEPTSPQQASLSADQIAKLVSQAIDGKESDKVASANKAQVIKALTDKFGDKAEEKYLEAGAKFGLGAQTLDSLSAKSPNAVLSWFPETAKTATPTNHGLSTEQFRTDSNPGEVNLDIVKQGARPCTTNDAVAAWREIGKLRQSN